MKVLWLHKSSLWPVYGGRLRTWNLLRELAKRHEITFCYTPTDPTDHDATGKLLLSIGVTARPWGEAFHKPWLRKARSALWNLLFSTRPAWVDYPGPPAAPEAWRRLLAKTNPDLIVFDFPDAVPVPCWSTVPIPKILFAHNAEYVLLTRRSTCQPRWVRGYLQLQARRMARYERTLLQRVDAVVGVSKEDKEDLLKLFPRVPIYLIDTAAAEGVSKPDFAGQIPDTVLFVGTLSWPPNTEGLHWFIQEVWPRIRAVRPACRLWIVGRDPCSELLQLHQRGGIDIEANVVDIRSYYQRAQVVIAPVQTASGTRLKIAECLAMARPLVATQAAAQGLPVQDGVHCLIADEPRRFAKAVLELLQDTGLRERLARAGWELAQQCFSPAVAAAQFEAICHTVLTRRRASRPRDWCATKVPAQSQSQEIVGCELALPSV
jgi:glycosyltransferase involved in cell wall biosynthesis